MADPSTVVDMTGSSPKIIRQGKVITHVNGGFFFSSLHIFESVFMVYLMILESFCLLKKYTTWWENAIFSVISFSITGN